MPDFMDATRIDFLLGENEKLKKELDLYREALRNVEHALVAMFKTGLVLDEYQIRNAFNAIRSVYGDKLDFSLSLANEDKPPKEIT